MLSIVGIVMSQSTGPRLLEPGAKRKFIGLSHIELDLGQRNTLLIGFDRYDQVQARRNIDSVLRLFVADYRKVEDTTQSPTRATHALVRLGETDRALSLRYTSELTTSFRFNDNDEPVQVKTQQDTLQLVWTSLVSAAIPNDFSIYLLVNSLHDIDRLLRSGGVNQKLQQALESVRQYKHHDLTSPKMAFTMMQSIDSKAKFLNPGSAKNPYLSFQPGIAVGLIRNQWVPSLNLDIQYLPSRFHQRGYSIGYTSNFFFVQSPTDGRFQLFRNDFVTIGVTIYRRSQEGQATSFGQQLVSFYMGLPVYRRGPYFDYDEVRMGSTVYQKGLLKVQAEVYTKEFFRNVHPSVRLVVGF
jgi:hypothetical protein